MCIYAYVWAYTCCGWNPEVRGQLFGTSFLLLSCGSWDPVLNLTASAPTTELSH